MAFVTKKSLPRRTFLRGVGITLALPLLDSMIPAGTRLVHTAALPKSRFCGIYIPHGATMDKWTPATEGSGFAFSETLKPLEKLRDRLTIVSNLAHPMAGGKGSDAGADHARSAAVFLSGAHPEKGTVHSGKTIDQLLADHIGQETPLPSIERQVPLTPCANRRRSLSLAVTIATRAPARENADRIVSASRYDASFIITATPVSRSRKKLPLMPCTDGGTPVTIDTLFGLVKLGSADSTSLKNLRPASDRRYGATPAAIARSMYSNDEPSRQTTTTGRAGQRYVRPLTATARTSISVSGSALSASSRPP